MHPFLARPALDKLSRGARAILAAQQRDSDWLDSSFWASRCVGCGANSASLAQPDAPGAPAVIAADSIGYKFEGLPVLHNVSSVLHSQNRARSASPRRPRAGRRRSPPLSPSSPARSPTRCVVCPAPPAPAPPAPITLEGLLQQRGDVIITLTLHEVVVQAPLAVVC